MTRGQTVWGENPIRFCGYCTAAPLERLLTIFDALEDSIRQPDFHGCPFIKSMSEIGPDQMDAEIAKLIEDHFANAGSLVAQLLKQISPEKGSALIQTILSLITGTIVVGQVSHQPEVARKNKEITSLLLRKT